MRFDAELPDTSEARDLWTLIQRGDVDQMSFAFRVIRQKWNPERTERTLTEVSLADGDVSVVTYPAYPTTTVEAREHLQNAVRAVKEGREISGESLLVLQEVFNDLTEGHDYIMKAVEVMATLMDLQDAPAEDMPAEDIPAEDTPAEDMPMAGRAISLRLAKAIVNSTK